MSELLQQLRKFEGKRTGEPSTARDPVNLPMIRHWCDAMGDRNPVYTDPAFAARSVHAGIVAPPTMLQAWNMPGLRPRQPLEAPSSRRPGVMHLLDDAGFTSVVATNCTQEYLRYLRPGDALSVTQEVESISDEKKTALGVGHFVTTLMTYRDQNGDEVATMRFRILKFRPPAKKLDAVEKAATTRPRPLPSITHDNAFFWEGVEKGVLLIQRCICGALRHPPGPMCPKCQSLEWDALESSGRGVVYSFVLAHHPKIPPFADPNPIVLVELEEGTRIVSNLVGIDPETIEIGMCVRARFDPVAEGRTLLQFELAEA